MTSNEKALIRDKIEREGWNRYGIIDDEPSVLYWHGDKELEIMYEDMDGRPCFGRAVYIHETFGMPHFVGASGAIMNANMRNVFAWREVENVK